MRDDSAARRANRGAGMNGDGSGSPPWGPADPVPELDDTQAIPGLGAIPGPNGASNPGGDGTGADGAADDGNARGTGDPAAPGNGAKGGKGGKRGKRGKRR